MAGGVNLDRIPLPARHLLDLDDYRIEKTPTCSSTSAAAVADVQPQGLPYACIYCDVQQKQFNFSRPTVVSRNSRI